VSYNASSSPGRSAHTTAAKSGPAASSPVDTADGPAGQTWDSAARLTPADLSTESPGPFRSERSPDASVYACPLYFASLKESCLGFTRLAWKELGRSARVVQAFPSTRSGSGSVLPGVRSCERRRLALDGDVLSRMPLTKGHAARGAERQHGIINSVRRIAELKQF
jgi:hypothetical protein